MRQPGVGEHTTLSRTKVPHKKLQPFQSCSIPERGDEGSRPETGAATLVAARSIAPFACNGRGYYRRQASGRSSVCLCIECSWNIYADWCARLVLAEATNWQLLVIFR